MQQREISSKTVRSDFTIRRRMEKQAAEQHAAEARRRSPRAWADSLRRVRDSGSPLYRRLVRDTAVCLALALGILALRAIDWTPVDISGGAEQQTASEMQLDEDLGRLKFVGGEEQQPAAAVSYSLPLEGEVAESFSETERNVTIRSEANAKVAAILPGSVVKTTADCVVVANVNGTQTTYEGLVPVVIAGDTVKSAQTVGYLTGEALCLETVSSIGYVDSLNAQALSETIPGT